MNFLTYADDIDIAARRMCDIAGYFDKAPNKLMESTRDGCQKQERPKLRWNIAGSINLAKLPGSRIKDVICKWLVLTMGLVGFNNES